MHRFSKCGVSTSVVHRLPKPRRRVRFPYTALRAQARKRAWTSRSVYRCGEKEKHTCFNLIGRGKSGQHRAPQRLTAVRQKCLVTATETSDVKRAYCGLQFQVNRRLSAARVSRRVGSERRAWQHGVRCIVYSVRTLEINDRRPKGYRTRLIDLLCSPEHKVYGVRCTVYKRIGP